MTVPISEEWHEKILSFGAEHVKTFLREFSRAYSEVYVKTHIVRRKHNRRTVLPSATSTTGTRKIVFNLSKAHVVDSNVDKEFILYTINAHDGQRFYTVHRRYDEFKRLHEEIRTRVFNATLPMRSKGIFGISSKKTDEEFAEKRIPKLRKYLAACVTSHNSENALPELKKFLFGIQRDNITQTALELAFQRTTNMSTVLHEDVGEGLVKWICEVFDPEQQTELRNTFKGKEAQQMITYYRAMIEQLDPTVEYSIENKIKDVQATIADFNVSRKTLTAEFEKLSAQVKEAIGKSLETATVDSQALITKFVNEFTKRLERVFSGLYESRKRCQHIIDGFTNCRMPDSTMSCALSLTLTDTLNAFKGKVAEAFKETPSFADESDPKELTNELQHAYLLFPLFAQIFAESVDVDSTANIYKTLVEIRDEMKNQEYTDKELKEAQLAIVNLIDKHYLDELCKIEVCKDALFEALSTRKEIDGNNTNSILITETFLEILKKFVEMRKHCLIVFADRFFSRAFVGLSKKQIDAAFRYGLEKARKTLKKGEKTLLLELTQSFACASLISASKDSIIEECMGSLKNIVIPEKYKCVFNIVTITNVVLCKAFRETISPIVITAMKEMWQTVKKSVEKEFNFFERELAEIELSSEEGLSGSCSCDTPACSCRSVKVAQFKIEPIARRKKYKLKAKADLENIAKLKPASSKKQIKIDSNEDSLEGVNFLSSDSTGNKGKVKAKSTVKVDAKLNLNAKADVNVDPKIKADLKVQTESVSSDNETAKVEAKVEPKLKVDAKVEPKLKVEAKVEPKLKVEAKAEPKLKAEAKVEPKLKVEAKVEPKLKVEAKVEPKLKVEAKVEPKLKVEAKAEAKVEPKLKVEAKVEPKLKVEAKVEPKLKAEAKVEPKLKVEAKVEPKLKVEAKVEPKLKVEAKAEAKVEPKLKVEAKVEPKLKVEAKVEKKKDKKTSSSSSSSSSSGSESSSSDSTSSDSK